MKYKLELNSTEQTYTLKYIFNCNECSCMSVIGNEAICKEFEDNETGNYYLESYDINFLNGEKKTYLRIPKWCKLKDSTDKGFYDDLSLSNKVENVENFKHKSNIAIYNKEDNYEKCSFCNEKSESVNRKINNGLCKFCLDKTKNNNTILNIAKKNNFKLKRIDKYKNGSYSFNDDFLC